MTEPVERIIIQTFNEARAKGRSDIDRAEGAIAADRCKRGGAFRGERNS